MTRTVLAEHELEDGTEMGVAKERGEYWLAWDGPLGLEHVVYFTDVEFEERRIVFRHNSRGVVDGGKGSRVFTIEGSPDRYGMVGEVLREISERPNYEGMVTA